MDTKNHFSSLTTLAMLKVNYDSSKTYIDIFLPFIIDSLSESDGLSLQDIQTSIEYTYKLKIPLNSLKTIIRRSVRRNILKAEGYYYLLNKDQPKKYKYEKLRNEALRQQNKLINTIIEYFTKEFGKTYMYNDIESALFEYLRYRDIELLRSTVFGSPFKDETTPPSKELLYYLSRFIMYISEHDQYIFELLADYVKSYMLSELLIFENISDIDQPFRKIDFYLDTQFVLRVLGYTYPQFRKASKELIDLIYSEGGNLYVFEHTVTEIKGILYAIEKTMRSHSYPKMMKEVGRYCVDNKISPSDLIIMISSIDKLLKEKGIEIKSTPPHESEYEIGEKELEDYLNINYKYRNPSAMDRDIDSISAMYRLRKGNKPISLKSCKSVFITTNANLAKHTYSFLYKEENYTHFPLLITDHLATNLLWSKYPKKFGEISKKQFLADAFALTNPSDYVWEKYFNEIEKLRSQNRITDEDALLLIYSSEVQEAIMEITFGGTIEPNAENIFDIIGRARARITQSDKIKLKELEKKLNDLPEVEAKLKNGEQKIIELENELVAKNKIVFSKENKIKLVIRKSSKITSFIIITIPSILIIISLFNFTPYPINLISSSVFIVFSLINLFFGHNLKGIYRKLEVFLYNKILDMLDLD